jgi:hypothetical protein
MNQASEYSDVPVGGWRCEDVAIFPLSLLTCARQTSAVHCCPGRVIWVSQSNWVRRRLDPSAETPPLACSLWGFKVSLEALFDFLHMPVLAPSAGR